MPATFSRRKATHRNDISDIEDDATTQHAAQDDVEESDEEPTSRRVKLKEKRNRRAQQEVNNDSDSDSDEAIDIENFPAQPLKRDQMSTLLSLGDDWQKMVEVISRPFGKYGMAAGALADLDDEDAKVRVDEIDGYMRESLDLVGIMKAHKEALNGIRQKGLQGEPLTQVGELYTQAAKTNVSNYKAKTTRQKYAKDEVYVAFKSSVWVRALPAVTTPFSASSLNTGIPTSWYTNAPDHGANSARYARLRQRLLATPPDSISVAPEQKDNSDEDDDLEIGGVTQNYQCPITLTLLDDPYTSTVCGHSFSAAAIKTTFRTSSAINKCPAAGCNKSFRLVDCKPNKDLAKKVKAHKRRLEKEQEDSDAEEVVD